MIYRALRDCIWQGKYWCEGDLTDPLSSDVVPCRHFELYKQKAVVPAIEKELTMSEITEQFAKQSEVKTGINAPKQRQQLNKKQ